MEFKGIHYERDYVCTLIIEHRKKLFCCADHYTTFFLQNPQSTADLIPANASLAAISMLNYAKR